MSEEKKELKQEQLNKVSGGAIGNLVKGKYYCIVSAYENVGTGLIPMSTQLGPHDTLEQAKEAGLSWAIDAYNNGYVNIMYIPGQWTDNGWIKYEEIHYPVQ